MRTNPPYCPRYQYGDSDAHISICFTAHRPLSRWSTTQSILSSSGWQPSAADHSSSALPTPRNSPTSTAHPRSTFNRSTLIRTGCAARGAALARTASSRTLRSLGPTAPAAADTTLSAMPTERRRRDRCINGPDARHEQRAKRRRAAFWRLLSMKVFGAMPTHRRERRATPSAAAQRARSRFARSSLDGRIGAWVWLRPPQGMGFLDLGPREWQLHPPHASLELPIIPAAMAIEPVGSERWIQIRREPSRGAARLRQPTLSTLHQPCTKSATFVLG